MDETSAVFTTMDSKKRYFEVDAARCFAMFAAVIVHSSNVYSPYDLSRTANVERFEFFGYLSKALGLFISPTFMLIGGFFTAYLLCRTAPITLLKKRLLRLGVPLLFTAVTFGVFESYQRYASFAAKPALNFIEFLGSDSFYQTLANSQWLHQTWFILQLVIFISVFLIAVALLKPVYGYLQRPVNGLNRVLDVIVGFKVRLLILAVLLAVFQFGLVGVVVSLIPDPYQAVQLFGLGIQSPFYLAVFFPYFLFGLGMFAFRNLGDAVLVWSWPVFTVGIIGFLIPFHLVPFETLGALGDAVLLAKYFVTWSLVFVILQIMHRLFKEIDSTRLVPLTDAAMTVYLTHHALVYFFGEQFVALQLPVIVEWLSILVLSLAFPLLLHFLVVRRAPLVRLALNGQTKGPAYSLGHLFNGKKT